MTRINCSLTSSITNQSDLPDGCRGFFWAPTTSVHISEALSRTSQFHLQPDLKPYLSIKHSIGATHPYHLNTRPAPQVLHQQHLPLSTLLGFPRTLKNYSRHPPGSLNRFHSDYLPPISINTKKHDISWFRGCSEFTIPSNQTVLS